jgi:UDP-glucose 4-epimerase
MDLADGHLAAIDYMQSKKNDSAGGVFTFNLGTGQGISVLEMIQAMSMACGHDIAYKVGPRRPGDIAVCYSDASLAETEMHWKAVRTLEDMCRDLWAWQSTNPNGYGSE